MNNRDKNISISEQPVSVQIEVDSYLSSVVSKQVKDSKKKLSKEDFLKFGAGEDTNLKRIWQQYDKQERKDYEEDYNNGTLPYIKPSTVVMIPTDKLQLEFVKAARSGQFLSQVDMKSFWAEKYETLINNEDFFPEPENLGSGPIDVRIAPQSLKVWIYLRSINKIVDISSFVLTATSIKSKSSGNFMIRIAPFRGDGATGFKDGFSEVFNVFNDEGRQVRSFIEKYSQLNDVVFLRFEKLKMEKDTLMSEGSNDLEIPPNMLVNEGSNFNVWDMIGLVDTVSVDVGDSMGSVSISGRDFSKLFTEDGSYFMPLKWVEGSKDRWFYGGDEQDEWFKRNVVTGNYDYLFNYGFRGIRETLWFVINVLSNMGIVPDDLFSAYKGRRTKSYEIDDNNEHKSQKVNGIWQIVKVFVEDKLEDRSVVDPSFANPDGSLMSFVNKICQEPFVEVIFDTYIDTLDIVVRQPPFNEEAIKDIVEGNKYITIESGKLINYSLSYDDRAYSWYQLFPQNNFTGTRDFTSLAYIPIIYLNEYTKIWGNKKQQINDIYISLSAISGTEGTSDLNSMAAAMLNDLLFTIETSAYLPFTRRGTITLTGDRRIKVGTFVRLEATDELFYVTNVVQEIAFGEELSRTTILTVERGMYFPILSGNLSKDIRDNTDGSLDMGGEKPSYFKIVEIDKIREDIKNIKVENNDSKAAGGKHAVNKQQFEYFLKRKMYDSGKQ